MDHVLVVQLMLFSNLLWVVFNRGAPHKCAAREQSSAWIYTVSCEKMKRWYHTDMKIMTKFWLGTHNEQIRKKEEDRTHCLNCFSKVLWMRRQNSWTCIILGNLWGKREERKPRLFYKHRGLSARQDDRRVVIGDLSFGFGVQTKLEFQIKIENKLKIIVMKE